MRASFLCLAIICLCLISSRPSPNKPATIFNKAFFSPSPVSRKSAAPGSSISSMSSPCSSTFLRTARGRHSLPLEWARSSAMGSPSIMRQRIRSPLPIFLKRRISSFTHLDFTALGEHKTIKWEESFKASSMTEPSCAEPGSSSRSRKMG